MDQLADLLRARCAQAGDGDGDDQVTPGVRALLGSLADAAAAAVAPSASSSSPSLPPSAASSSFGVDVSIHGPGAAGSTHLANFLLREAGLRCNLLVDPDGCRHAPWPPPPPPPPPSTMPAAAARTPSSSSLIYLYSDDPLMAAASFYRRGIAREQALKLSGAAALASAPRDDFDLPRARAALALSSSGGFPPTLDAYLEQSGDLFGFDAHLSSWLTRPAAAEIVFLRYEGAFEKPVARAFFRRLLWEARAQRRRRPPAGAAEEGGAEEETETDARAERLAREWYAQRRERRTQPTAAQRERGESAFAAFSARVSSLPHGGCFVRPADASSAPPEQWEALAMS